MRWPIRRQLLVPMVGVVLLAGILATIITAAGLAVRVRNEQREDLRRVVKTLGEANFPLTGPVLAQVKGLSGAELVLVGPDGRIDESTLAAEPAWLEDLARTRVARGPAGAQAAALALGGRSYLVDSVHVPGVAPGAKPSTLWVLIPRTESSPAFMRPSIRR